MKTQNMLSLIPFMSQNATTAALSQVYHSLIIYNKEKNDYDVIMLNHGAIDLHYQDALRFLCEVEQGL